MLSATAYPNAANATLVLALGPRVLLVYLLRSLADRIERGRETKYLDFDLAIRRLPRTDLAASTREKYAGALRRLKTWLDGRPATDALLATYLGVLYDDGLAPPSAGLVVAAARRAVKDCAAAGLHCVDPVGPETTQRLGRFRRDGAGRGRGQVQGVSWEEADLICERADADGDAAGKRDAAMVGIASDALLRVSEVAGLNVADVSFWPDGSARAAVRRSKTDQRGDGDVLYVTEKVAARLRCWMATADVGSGPLFRAVGRGGRVSEAGLGPDSVRAAFKRRAAESGIGGRVSGHSLRVGAAQSLSERHVSLAELQRSGRWKSPAMPGYYVRNQEASRGAVAKLRGGVGKSR